MDAQIVSTGVAIGQAQVVEWRSLPWKGPFTHLSPITKVVLHVWSDGTCSLLTVPLDWRVGQPLPADVADERYDTPANAMVALAEAGRAQNPAMSWYRDPTKRELASPAEGPEAGA